jgi:hypothetical protein
MRNGYLECSRCRYLSPLGTRYCPNCGEAVDPALVTELRQLYERVRVLDELIAEGQGGRTVSGLRDEISARYLALRHSPSQPAATATTTTAPDQALPTAAVAQPAAAPIAAAIPPAAAVVAAPAAGGIGDMALAARPPEPRGPVFSWRAFVADQAIAIMAYLGGFLLLVATLSFIVGGWQALDDLVKLAAVSVVYLVFGVLGVALRRSARLAAVGRVYLGVFALMTPLVALATYRFALQGLGFPVSGIVCVSAAYAAVIYLALGWRTDFVPYTYIGWTAFLVAGLAIVPWADVPREWEFFALAALALALLLPHQLRRFSVAAALAVPAMQLASLATAAAVLGAEVVGLSLIGAGSAPGGTTRGAPSPAAFALASCALIPLAVLWSHTLRTLDTPADAALTDLSDWSIAAFAAQAVAAVAIWRQVDARTMAILLAALALAELGGAVLLRLRAEDRFALRASIETLAAGLAIVGAGIVWGNPAPNWPLITALSAGMAVLLGVALIEGMPWWALAAGLFFSLDYYQVVAALTLGLSTPNRQPTDTVLGVSVVTSSYAAIFTLTLWSLALGLSFAPRMRRYAGPVYLTALGNALYTLPFLPGYANAYVTVILATFALAALLAGWREGRLVAGGLVTGFFGLLAVLPYTAFSADGHAVALAMLTAAAVPLAVRRLFGRGWAVAPHVVGLWAALLGGLHLTGTVGIPVAATTTESFASVSFATWALLGVALLAAVAALWEDVPAAMAPAALLVLWAQLVAGDHKAAFILALILVGAGIVLRVARDRAWAASWYLAALAGSAVAVLGLRDLGADGQIWQVAELGVFALLAYLVAVLERDAAASLLAVLYAAAATYLFPGNALLVPTLVVVGVAAALGLAISSRFCGRWALALYLVAAQASIFAVARAIPSGAGAVEALLLVFAAVAFVVMAVEREPLAGFAPALYAAAAVVAQPDAHALLPLALSLALLGMAVSRVAGIHWAWPWYAASSVAAGFTAVLGQSAPGFEAIALAALVVVSYAIAWLESRADLLPLPLVLGVLAVASGARALDWTEWQTLLALTGLAWVYVLGEQIWSRLPGLRRRSDAWWASLVEKAPAAWSDPRVAGGWVHLWGGVLLGVAVSTVALAAEESFAVRSAATETVVLAFLALAGMLGYLARKPRLHVLWYVAGELVALAITWQARWLGADNLQAFILAPGSYQLVVGALAPSDARLGHPVRAGQVFSLLGALILLLPTLGQSFSADPTWVYALALAAEALLIAGAGVGTRSRLLVLTGSLFVGAAALRGAVLAVDSGVPIALVIAALALLLMGGATWLSLRARREVIGQTP